MALETASWLSPEMGLAARPPPTTSELVVAIFSALIALATAAYDCRIHIEFDATHAIMDHGRDAGDIEWLGLQCGAREEIVEELLARVSLSTGCIPGLA